jgi:hypothetical protein
LENEEVNVNFRKVMRAQEHLHKGGSSSDASMLKSKSRGAINQSICPSNTTVRKSKD